MKQVLPFGGSGGSSGRGGEKIGSVAPHGRGGLLAYLVSSPVCQGHQCKHNCWGGETEDTPGKTEETARGVGLTLIQWERSEKTEKICLH